MFTKLDIEKYFTAEKSESLLFVIIGSVAIVTAIVFFFILKTSIYKGMAVPLVFVAVIQIVVGITVYKRSDAQRKDILYKMDMNTAAIKENEIPRMQMVMKKFIIYRWVEIILLATGLALIFIYQKKTNQSFIFGFGIGLAIQAAIMLGADFFAKKRGEIYLDGIKAYKPTSMHV